MSNLSTNKLIMQNLELQAIQEFAKSDLISFCVYMNPDYEPQPFHIEIAKKLEDIYYKRINRLIINIWPRHWKSELVSKMFPIRCMGKNPKIQIMNASYSADLSNQFSRQCLNLINTPEYKSLFDLNLITESVNHRETKNGWYYHAVWVGGSATWFWFDIGIIDDPVKNREEAESQVIRAKTKDRYTSTYATRQGKNAWIVIIQTRWHIDDLTGRLETKEKEWWDKREKITFKAIDENNNVLWPSKFTLQRLQSMRVQIWVRDFAALYQQDPITSTGAIFKPHYFRYVLLSDFDSLNGIDRKQLKTWLFIDPAFSSSAKSDDAVAMFVAQHEITKRYYVIDIYADTSAPSLTIKAIFDMAEKWHESYWFNKPFVSIEKVAINKNQDKFIEDVKAEMRYRGKEYKLVEYSPKVKKEDRIKYHLEPPLSNWNMFFLKNTTYTVIDWFRKLEEQLLMFPNSNHDDVMDCLAQAVNVFENQARWININKSIQTRWRQYRSPELGKMVTV